MFVGRRSVCRAGQVRISAYFYLYEVFRSFTNTHLSLTDMSSEGRHVWNFTEIINLSESRN